MTALYSEEHHKTFKKLAFSVLFATFATSSFAG